jgi:hypothetical protein
MKKLLIANNRSFHYEIIESVIVKYKELLGGGGTPDMQIYLHLTGRSSNPSFVNYIQSKYPSVIFKSIKDYHRRIDCTVYDKHAPYPSPIGIWPLNSKSDSNTKYIGHRITDRLKKNPNVYWLTPLAKKNYFNANILPFSSTKIGTKIPIYMVQGASSRRDWRLLIKILERNYGPHEFNITLLGKGKFPEELSKYKAKVTMKCNLNFCDYHKQFASVYCILPLTTKATKKQYYTTQLTSTINYASGYNLKCLIDRDLQKIYNLKDVEVFNDGSDIAEAFGKTLRAFYSKGAS